MFLPRLIVHYEHSASCLIYTEYVMTIVRLVSVSSKEHVFSKKILCFFVK